ncbi:MAG: nucleotidyltransferase domain-containing protein [Anaerolineaceae bacterium]|nr:nucleotidyltransferase domain-containing protein [Anaerolineaceae bacterium]
MITLALHIPQDAIITWCERWQVVEFALFGSVLREDFHQNSDVDILITFANDAQPTLFTLSEMSDELEALLGRPVDLLTRKGVEQSENYLRKNAILDSAQVIYAT